MMSMATSLPWSDSTMATLLSEDRSHGKKTLVLSGHQTQCHLKLRGGSVVDLKGLLKHHKRTA